MSASIREPSDPAVDYRAYLDPAVLAKISGLELRARMIVEGFFSGMHHSPFHGLSAEFADHRIYGSRSPNARFPAGYPTAIFHSWVGMG